MAFTTNFTYVINGLEVVCTDATVTTPPSNPPIYWSWHVVLTGPDFYSYEQNTSIVFPEPGSYTIFFTSSNDDPGGFGAVSAPVTVYGVSFTAEYENDNDTLNISFFDLSTPLPTAWLWNFGDGGTSTEQNPLHRYATSGTYTVVLTVDGHTYTRNLVVAAPQSKVLALANDGHIFKSEDDGQTWVDQGLKVSPYESAAHGMDVSYGLINFGGGILVAYTGHNYIERSTDFGETWASIPVSYFVNHDHVARAGVSLGAGKGLLAGFHFNPTCTDLLLGSILITLDYGLTWSITTNTNNYGTYLAFSSFAKGKYVTSLRAALYGACGLESDSKTQINVSDNQGGRWTTVAEAISYSLDTPNSLMTTMLPDGKTLIPRTRTSLRAYDFVSQLFTEIDPNKVFDRIYWSKSGKLFASSGEYEDVMTFTPRTTASFTFWSVAYGNGVFVAVGAGTTVMTSVNGITWTWGARLPSNTYYNVIFGNGVFVATGYTGGRIYTSSNGLIWSLVYSGIQVPVQRIIYAGGLYVISNSTDTLVSSDLVNWSDGDTPDVGRIAYGAGKYVAAAGDGSGCYTSLDGLTWNFFSFSKVLTSLISIAYGNGTFVVVGSSSGFSTDTEYIFTSTDGENWTLREAPETNDNHGIFYGNGLFVVYAEYKTHSIMTSPDGIKWTMRSDRNTTKSSGVYANGLYVIVCSSGGSSARVVTSPGPVIISDPTPTLYRSSDRGDSFDNILEDYETWTFFERTFGGSVIISDFTADPLSGISPLIVQFTDASIGSPVSWGWDFGDGVTSTLQNPTHTYRRSGYYTVTLSVSDGSSSDTEIKTEYIHVNIITDFSATPVSGKIPLSVFFTDKSKDAPSHWTWNFGDGTVLSGTQNPRHDYTTPGIYTVSLTASSGSSTDTEIKEDYIVALYTLYTEDIAIPEDRQDLRFVPIKGNGNYLFKRNGIQVMILRSSTSPVGSGFSRSSGPSLIFD